MSLPIDAPREWQCSRCPAVNHSGPRVTNRSDGGEIWTLICQRCLTKYPVAEITAKGVRIRRRLRTTTQDRQKRRLLEALQSEITKP